MNMGYAGSVSAKLGLFASLVLSASAWAQQQQINSVLIDSKPSGLQIYVDGQAYKAPINVLWPVGSKHTLSTIQTQNDITGIRYEFGGWLTNRGDPTQPGGTTVLITADPEIKEVVASFSTSYRVRI